MFFFLQLTGDISHLRLGLLKEGFSRPQSEPDVDELVKKGAEGLAKKTCASLPDISVPMHLDGKVASPHFAKLILTVTTTLVFYLSLLRNSVEDSIRYTSSLSKF